MMESSELSVFDKNLLENNIFALVSPIAQSDLQHNVGPDESKRQKEVEKVALYTRELLSTKKALEMLLNGTLEAKVCRYCLNVVSPLSDLDEVMQIANYGTLYKVSIREMIASFHPSKIADDKNFPNKICDKCIKNTLRCYLYAQQCEQSERALRNYFEDMYNKLDKLDPIERPKKRGRQKLHFNPNVIVTEHKHVIDYAEPLITIVNIGCSLTDDEAKDPYTCAKCLEVLPTIESKINHEKSHPKSMCYHCRHCGKSFPNYKLLKKHDLSTHNNVKDVTKETDFKCKECGVVNEDYHLHLQHVEKHKFQVVMHHLITRKMHKLCSICLNKGSKLSALEKKICLHGGYPEIMGDRTVYNILESTIPDKSPLKYQELLVPVKLKILSIVSKKRQRMRKNAAKDVTYKYILSTPKIISKEKILFKKIYSYVLTEPYFENEEQLSAIGMNSDSMITDSTIASSNSGTEIKFDVKPAFIFSSPLHQDAFLEQEQFNVKISHTARTSKKLCNPGWIFPKTTNQMHLYSTENITKENHEISEICKSCWLFQKCDKCGVCNKPIINCYEKIVAKVSHPVESTEKYSSKYSEIFLMVSSLEKNNANEPIIRNKEPNLLFEDNNDDKVTWQCKICLSSNFQCEVCTCCESPRYTNESKVNFKFKNIFLDTMFNDNNETVTESNIKHISCGHEKIDSKTASDMDVVCDAIVSQTTNLQQQIEAETLTTRLLEQIEPMEVCEEQIPETTKHAPNLTDLQLWNCDMQERPFVFNIGVFEDKKHTKQEKKPLRRRRLAITSYHK